MATRIRGVLPAVLTVVAVLAVCAPAGADEVYTFVVKKQEKKEQNRWSLSQWLETRDRMRLMDLWLALHSPSPYEFYLGGDWGNENAASGRLTDWRVYGAAYASIFGLELQKEISSLQGASAAGVPSTWHGLFHLRVFGYHAQSTNITLQGGLRSTSIDAASGGGAYRNPLAGVAMSIYLMKFFGVNGLWRHYFAATPNSVGAVDRGNLYEGGAFLDFKFVRVYGTYFTESLSTPSNGFRLGLRLFF